MEEKHMFEGDVGRKVRCTKKSGGTVEGHIEKRDDGEIGVKVGGRFYPTSRFSDFFRGLAYLSPAVG